MFHKRALLGMDMAQPSTKHDKANVNDDRTTDGRRPGATVVLHRLMSRSEFTRPGNPMSEHPLTQPGKEGRWQICSDELIRLQGVWRLAWDQPESRWVDACSWTFCPAIDLTLIMAMPAYRPLVPRPAQS
jgi:hypothetical protein